MKLALTVHRKYGNRAIALLIQSTKLMTDPILSAGWSDSSFDAIVEALETIWTKAATEYRCNPANLMLTTNARIRKAGDPLLIWFMWGRYNGGCCIATLSLTE